MAGQQEIGSILVIDDDAEGRSAIKAALNPERQTRIFECDSSSALHRYLDQQTWTWFPAFALVDLVLPAISGYDVVRRLRARFIGRRIPIIVVSKMSTGEDILESQVAGADAFVRKPFSNGVLTLAIDDCLENEKKSGADKRYSIAYYL